MFAVIALVIYFFPFIVACVRRHRNQTAIFVLNLFTGWTGLGWIAALVWACTANTESSAAPNQLLNNLASRYGRPKAPDENG